MAEAALRARQRKDSVLKDRDSAAPGEAEPRRGEERRRACALRGRGVLLPVRVARCEAPGKRVEKNRMGAQECRRRPGEKRECPGKNMHHGRCWKKWKAGLGEAWAGL